MLRLRKIILASIVIGILFFVGRPSLAKEETALNQESLNEIYSGELYAIDLYEAMIEKFDNDEYYERLLHAEERHAESIKRFLERNYWPWLG